MMRMRLLGLLLLLASGMILMQAGRNAYAEYRFKTMVPPAETNSIAIRLEYAENLRGLLRIDPGNSPIRGRLATVLATLGQNEPAIQELQRYLKTQRAQNSLDALAQMLERTGQFDAAIDALSNSMVMNPYTVETNQALLRLLNQRMDRLKSIKNRTPEQQKLLDKARRDFALQSLNWYVRAYQDPNAALFMANSYIEPLYPLQAYRHYLAGLSVLQLGVGESYRLMIAPQSALNTVGQILRGRYARPYRELP